MYRLAFNLHSGYGHRSGLWVSGFFARALLAGLAILKRTAGEGEAPDGGAASAFSAIVAIN